MTEQATDPRPSARGDERKANSMTLNEEAALAREIRQLVDRLNNRIRAATQQRLHVEFTTRDEPDILFPVTLLDVKILKEL